MMKRRRHYLRGWGNWINGAEVRLRTRNEEMRKSQNETTKRATHKSTKANKIGDFLDIPS
jgi:hypothetical protein